MGKIKALTYKEKVLIYLRDFTPLGELKVYPPEISQKGIADGVGMGRTHVSRVMRDLLESKDVKEGMEHIKGRSRKLKVYSLTGKGLEEGARIMEEIGDIEVRVRKDGDEFWCSIEDIMERVDGKVRLLDVLEAMEHSSTPLNLADLGPRRIYSELSGAPKVKELYGRSEVLTRLDGWLNGDVPVAILEGRKGLGASSTARRFLDSVDDRHLLWTNVRKEDPQKKMLEFFSQIGVKGENMNEIMDTRSLVVIDDYYDVDDELVDFFVELIDNMDCKSPCKFLVTTREGLPVYERFYHREHLKQGKVTEINVSPLTEEEAELILGNKIEPGALRRIMLMTKGSPRILKHLRDGKVKKIEEESALVREQISLLIFLKDQTI